MKTVALGFRVHSGWSVLVGVSLDAGKPAVVCRKRVQLVEIYNYDYRQPYHTAARVPIEEGREFVSLVRAQAVKLASDALCSVQEQLKPAGCAVSAAGLLLASGRALPALEAILVSHALIHTADGELFREALAGACGNCRIRLMRIKEKALLQDAERTLGMKKPALLKRAADLGRSFGAPWSEDEKFATLAAWLVLKQTTTDTPPRQQTKIPPAKRRAALA